MYGHPTGYHPQPLLPRPQYQQPWPSKQDQQIQNQHHNQAQIRHRVNQEGRRPCFDPIPMAYSQLLPHLVQNALVDPKSLKQLISPIPKWFNPNIKYEYHTGIVGHSTKDCTSFKAKVQEFIDNKLLTFNMDNPNVDILTTRSCNDESQGSPKPFEILYSKETGKSLKTNATNIMGASELT